MNKRNVKNYIQILHPIFMQIKGLDALFWLSMLKE